MRTLVFTILIGVTLASISYGQYAKQTLIAHRGASAYVPEHTLEAYRLAVEQHADYVEQDLQITKDGVLVCLHDTTLERTTDVEEIFPGRYTMARINGREAKVWNVSDFTLEEIKRLDAGSWFGAPFKGARVPTWQEAIAAVRGKAGLYPETKEPEFYLERGFDMGKLVMSVLEENGLSNPGGDPLTPVIIQSFSAKSLERLRTENDSRLPHLLLIADPRSEWLSTEGLLRARAFADGIGPAKEIIDGDQSLIRRAHSSGMSVTPYTFRSGNTGRFKSVGEEMRHFLDLGVDALFTDNPDQFPKR